MNEILKQNLRVLRNQDLAKKIDTFLKTETFKRFSMNEEGNIFDSNSNTFMYKDQQAELDFYAKAILEKTPRYPFLCLYGIGNALLVKNLAKQHYKYIFVFEGEIELLILALSKVNLSRELELGGIYIFDTSSPTIELELGLLFNNPKIMEWLYLYELFIQNDFYTNHFYEAMLLSDVMCQKAINNTLSSRGVWCPQILNEVYSNFLGNLKSTLKHIPFQRLINERKAACDSCVVVSAGPSLNKQLELLKQYQEEAVIFCVDGAYPVLSAFDIEPDYVLNNDFHSLALNFLTHAHTNKSLFVCAYSSNPKIIEFLEQKSADFCIVLGEEDPSCKMNFLNDFGYIDIGNCVSHFAYSLALALGFKNIIMIGQDFALSKEGDSHAKGYSLGTQAESKCDTNYFEVQGYGGGYRVQTHNTWNFYRLMLEHCITLNLEKATFYNATQGGARILFSQELSFKECCERFFSKKKPKFQAPKALTSNKANKLFTKALQKLKNDTQICQAFLNDAGILRQALESILNSNKDLPLAFLQNVEKNIHNFNHTLAEDIFLNDGKLSFVFAKRGEMLSELLKARLVDEKEHLLHFINIYKEWLVFFQQKLQQKYMILNNFLQGC